MKSSKCLWCCQFSFVTFYLFILQDPNEDTEWNDVLRAKGILPPKEEKEISEDEIIKIMEKTIQEKTASTYLFVSFLLGRTFKHLEVASNTICVMTLWYLAPKSYIITSQLVGLNI